MADFRLPPRSTLDSKATENWREKPRIAGRPGPVCRRLILRGKMAVARLTSRRMFPVNIIHGKAEQLGLKYLVIGGHAVNAYGTVRATVDVDLMVCRDDVEKWTDLLKAEGFKLKNDAGTFRQFTPPYGIEWPLDVMAVNASTFQKLAGAARPLPVLGITALVPSAEHLVALKLHALKHGRMERFDKDMGDVITLIKNAGIKVESPAFKEMVEQFGTAEIYERILKRLETNSGS